MARKIPKTKIQKKEKWLLNKFERISLLIISIFLLIVYTYDIEDGNYIDRLKTFFSSDSTSSYILSEKQGHTVPTIKLSVDIILSKRINETELEKLGKQIYKKYNGKKYKNVFIEYLLPNMTEGNGAYATTHFNPNLEVVLYGLSDDDIDKIKANGFTDKKYWIDDGMGIIVTITEENNQLYLNRYFRSLEHDRKKLMYVAGTDTLYEVKGSTGGEFYRINSLGELEQYDDRGLVYTMIRN